MDSEGDWEAVLHHSAEELLPRRIQFRKATQSDMGKNRKNRKKFRPINRPVRGAAPSSDEDEADPQPLALSPTGDDCIKGDEYLFSITGKPRVQLFDPNKLELDWKTSHSIGPGLRNLGNTCFLNSALQCLTYIPPLANLCLDRNHSKNCKRQGFCLFCVLETHVGEIMRRSKNQAIVPKAFVRNLRAICKHFRQGRQEDSHEFIRYVIDHLQRNSLPSNAKRLSKVESETSVVHGIFGGVLQSQVSCQKCPYESDTFDPCLDLSLDVKGCSSLQQILKSFCRIEVLDKDNQYRCERCKKLSRAHKQFTIFKAPTVAVFHLKRFNHMGHKVNKRLDFPEFLNLNPYMSRRSDRDVEQFDYRLCGVLVHMGSSIHSGHYYCFVRGPTGTWYELNDEDVQTVKLETVLKQQAYILFYVRQASSRNKSTPSTPTTPKSKKQSTSPQNHVSDFDQSTDDSDSEEHLRNLLAKRKRPQDKEEKPATPSPKKSRVEPTTSPKLTPTTPPTPRKSWKQVEPQEPSPKQEKNKKKKKKQKTKSSSQAVLPPVVEERRWDDKQQSVPTKSKPTKRNGSMDQLRALLSGPSHLTSKSVLGPDVGVWGDKAPSRAQLTKGIIESVQKAKPARRDQYDREYDEGKVKKVRKPTVSLFERKAMERVSKFDVKKNVRRKKNQKKSKKYRGRRGP